VSEGIWAGRVLEGIEAFNSRDFERVLEFVADDVEHKRIDGSPDEHDVVRGRDAMREFMLPDVFESQRLEPVAIVDDDDTVLVRVIFHARGAASGMELDVESFLVYKVEDGLIRRMESWRKLADAERSSGLRL
jgi:ketosteroid isomerase-like protein